MCTCISNESQVVGIKEMAKRWKGGSQKHKEREGEMMTVEALVFWVLLNIYKTLIIKLYML